MEVTMRYINADHVVAAQMTTPAENPLVSDATRLMDVWFGGAAVRKQLFKKVTKEEQEAFAGELQEKGFIRSGNLLIDPAAVFFAEMEHELVGGLVTIGFQENGRPVELKVTAGAFKDICNSLAAKR
jgi:hypothetical protein